MIEAIGAAAGLLTLMTYFPQAIKTIQSRRTDDLSVGTYSLLVLSAALWTVYGIIKGLPSIWATNSVVATLGLCILGLKLRSK